MDSKLRRLILVALLAGLSGCGGDDDGGGSSTNDGDGGGNNPPPTTTDTPFPLRATMKGIIATGVAATDMSSRQVGGTYTLTKTPAVPATFNGTSVLAQTTSTNLPGAPYFPYTDFFDADGTMVGWVATPTAYVWRTSATPLPVSADLGTQGVVGEYNAYSDQALTNPIWRARVTWSLAQGADATKQRADFILRFDIRDLAGGSIFVIAKRFVVSTSGGFNFAEEHQEEVGGRQWSLYRPNGGY